MSGCSTSASTEVRNPNQEDAVVDCSNLSKASDQDALQHENEVDEENKLDDGYRNADVAEEEDEDEDADFNPFLKETNSIEASSSLSSEVEDLELDVADSKGKQCAAVGNEPGKHRDTSGYFENCDENVMHAVVSSGKEVGKNLDLIYSSTTEKESALVNQSGNGSLFDKKNGLLIDIGTATDSGKSMVDVDAEGAICMRTRARYSLASFTLDELETFLQETDDEDDLQNVDDEEEYRKFLAAVLRGDDSQNLQENANADDEDEENDADFELELEEALESEPEEVEERRTTRRNRSQKASLEHSKNFSGQLNRPLRPLLPFASIESLSTAEGHFPPNFATSHMPPVNNGYNYGFTPHQIGQLHCLIHEHIQLLIQVFSLSVLEPGKSHIASEVKELVVQMLQKRDQALAWRTVPYPSFCFFPPYIHPSVQDGNQNMLPSTDGNKIAQRNLPCGSNRELHSDEQAGSSQTPEYHSWVPYVCGPVLSVTDVAPLKLVENYIDDVSSAVHAYDRYQIERGFETHGEKEPLFPFRNSLCSTESVGQGEMEENTPLDSNKTPSPSASHRLPKKNMAATLLDRAKNQPVAPVPKEIAKLAQRFWSLFNPALYPHKPAPASLTTRVLFTDTEDELLALGLMEYNTDWKAIQQRFLPCKSRHQIFVRQKNRASSKAPENPIKSVRRIKNAPLTLEEIARIELGLKKFKLDFMSIWRFFLPYRDPSLLPRQWRIATGTQKSYKSDANKKAKRRLYEFKRKSSKPSPSSWHSSSEKEGDSSDNAVEETNSGDNHIDKEDEAYVHEAFLADWMPENNASSSFPGCLPFQENAQAKEQKDKPGYRDNRPPIYSKSALASRPSTSEIVMRPYRARKPNNARLVKLAPDLPPVNLPPSVRIMSQSAFKNSQATTSAKDSGNIFRNAGLMAKNRTLHAGSNMQVGIGTSMQSGVTRNNHVNVTTNSQQRNLSDVATNKLTVERGDSDLQMHPLLFQAPQDCQLPYYPSSPSTSSSFSFFPGNQPQLSLSLFHNPRHIRDAVNFLSKSSKPPEKNAVPAGVDFHPLLQRTDDVGANSLPTHPAGRLPSTAASKPPIRSHLSSTSKASVDGNSSASGTKASTLSRKGNELDLNINLSFTAKNRASRNTTIFDTSRSLAAPAPGVVESESAKDYTPDGMSNQLDSTESPVATPRNRGSRKVADDMHDESLPEIVMEQEELSDSEEEFGENVEFECEEMADSEAESTSESEQVVNVPNEETHLDETDADIDDGHLQNDHRSNPCSTSEACSIGLDTGLHVKPNALSLNLNSCPPASQSNPKNAYEFGPFGARAEDDKFLVDLKGSGRMQKRASKHLSGDTPSRTPRKRVCRSNSNSNAAAFVENSKNVAKDELG
ncbi:hypothetical protein AAHA92_26084 [Salvia divinorum]|uniref:Homeodomain-like superfamily protein n=1 Tax=Salvia divinorum TaxID=28513 RepID=A0ABD1GCU4_SALDI